MPDSAVESTGLAGTEMEAEYCALQDGALVVDRSGRSRWRFRGARARETVAGLVTNDVAGLEVGRGCYAAALTPKGKIIADVRVFALPEAILVDTSPRATPGWAEIVRKYVNPRMAPYEDISADVADIGVFGRRAAHVTAAALGLSAESLMALPLYGSRETASADTALLAARVPDAGVEGFELFGPAALRIDLVDRLRRAGATAGTEGALEITRVEAGRPAWGVDMDEGTIPQEANFDELGAISYTKGCYTGQETVARLHFRGHVNRHLRGLRLAASGAVLPPPHASIVDAAGSAVGDVRSVVQSPRLGPIALAMIRREVPVGASLVVRWEAVDGHPGGEITASVQTLPFSAS